MICYNDFNSNHYCPVLGNINSSSIDNLNETTKWIFENNGSCAKVSKYSTWDNAYAIAYCGNIKYDDSSSDTDTDTIETTSGDSGGD